MLSPRKCTSKGVLFCVIYRLASYILRHKPPVYYVFLTNSVSFFVFQQFYSNPFRYKPCCRCLVGSWVLSRHHIVCDSSTLCSRKDAPQAWTETPRLIVYGKVQRQTQAWSWHPHIPWIAYQSHIQFFCAVHRWCLWVIPCNGLPPQFLHPIDQQHPIDPCNLLFIPKHDHTLLWYPPRSI